jgi:hypothetical protein
MTTGNRELAEAEVRDEPFSAPSAGLGGDETHVGLSPEHLAPWSVLRCVPGIAPASLERRRLVTLRPRMESTSTPLAGDDLVGSWLC